MRILIALFVLLPGLASADYSECILENMKGVGSDVAAEEIKKACEGKYKDKTPSGHQKDKSFSARGTGSEEEPVAERFEANSEYVTILMEYLEVGDLSGFAAASQKLVQGHIEEKNIKETHSAINEITRLVKESSKFSAMQKIQFLKPYLYYFLRELSICEWRAARAGLVLQYQELVDSLLAIVEVSFDPDMFVELRSLKTVDQCRPANRFVPDIHLNTLKELEARGVRGTLVADVKLQFADSLLMTKGDYKTAYLDYFESLSVAKEYYEAELVYPRLKLEQHISVTSSNTESNRIKVTLLVPENGRPREIEISGDLSARQKRYVKKIFKQSYFRPALLRGEVTLSRKEFELNLDGDSPLTLVPDKNSFLMRASPSKAQAQVYCGSEGC